MLFLHTFLVLFLLGYVVTADVNQTEFREDKTVAADVNQTEFRQDKAVAVDMNQTVFTDDKIVGGVQQQIKNRKFQVAVLLNGGLCGGTLIRYNWVVTAGHCTYGETASTIRVRAGSPYYYKYGGLRSVSKIVNFPKFNIKTLAYDIALLKLTSPFPKTSTIGIIALATTQPAPGSLVRVSGYGTISSGGNLPTSLRSVQIRTVDFKTCNKAYSGALTKTMFCAGLSGKDSCQGDSGGPLTYKGRLTGVVSWGNGCAEPKYPGVYTRVQIFAKWIKKQIGAK